MDFWADVAPHQAPLPRIGPDGPPVRVTVG